VSYDITPCFTVRGGVRYLDILSTEETTNKGDETMPRYPEITVELIGQDGNAFAVLGAVTKALKRAGVSKEEQDEFMQEATSGDYDHLLRTVMRWVEVGGDELPSDDEVDFGLDIATS